MSFREFEYADGKSFKFWKVELEGENVTTRYGRIGTTGQETVKSYGTDEKAQKAYDKLVAEKLGKGYVEKTSGGAAKPAKAEKKESGKKETTKKATGAKETGKKDEPAAAGAAPAGVREFEYADGKSFKFWNVELQGENVVTRYGRIGAAGQETVKSYGTADKALKAYEKLVTEKVSKGYVEKTSGGAAKPAKGAAKKDTSAAASSDGELSPMFFATTRDGDFDLLTNFIGERVTEFREGKRIKGKSVVRIRVSYDEEGDDEPDFEKRLQAFLESDLAAETRGLVLGCYDMEGGTTSSDAYKPLIKFKDRLPNLKALFLGDILQEEMEISWINHSDVSDILDAFPNLEMLRIRGASGLEFSKPKHAKLRALAIEAGGLPAKVVAQICRAKFPELEYLELWLGTPGYDGDCRVNDLQPILKGKAFPKLKYLGLRNSEIADDIAAVLPNSPVVDQLDILDLSLGNLSDVGANALLQLDGKSLQRLDLHHHYITKPVQKKLKQLPFPVDLNDTKTVDEEDEWSGRFISVSE